MAAILMMSAKLTTPGYLEIKIFWNKSCDVIIIVHDVTSETLSLDSDYIVDAVVWAKLCRFSISTREVIITSFLSGFDQKTRLFWGVVLVQVQ